MSASPPTAIVLLGPTASGKSACALAVAEHLPIEIISVDSAQIYRGLDLGTAKPSAAERARVAHHLIDIRDPSESYSVAAFCADARTLIDGIQKRGRIPLLVGGTMLYAHGLMHGLSDLPGADLAVRAQIEHEAKQHGWPALHRTLMQIDPETAARLAPSDAQRIQRALEVHRLTGQPLSALHHARPRHPTNTTMLTIALEPSTRSALHERIAQRFQNMVQAGLLEEVRALRARGDLHADMPALRCVGYRQAWAWLDQQTVQHTGPRLRSPSWIEEGIAATRQLAKRQLTWLRTMPERHVIDALGTHPEREVLKLLRTHKL